MNHSTQPHNTNPTTSVSGPVFSPHPDAIRTIADRLSSHKHPLQIANVVNGEQTETHILASHINGGSKVISCGFSNTDKLPFDDNSLDAIITFDTIQHLHLESFCRAAQRALRPGGLLAICTRTPEQNNRTIWGELFPEYITREKRLYTRDRLERAVYAVPNLQMESVCEFIRRRVDPTPMIIDRARSLHRTTWSLYSPEEFIQALVIFTRRLAELGNGTVEHIDENTLVLARRTDETSFTTDISP